MKSFGSVDLAEEVLRQPSLDCVVAISSHLFRPVMRRSKLDKKQHKCNVGVKSCAQGDKNKEKPVVRSKVSLRTRLHPAKVLTCDKD